MNKTYYSGSSTLGMLGVLFIALKLTDFIDWSWWWVLAPFWMPFPFALLLIVVFLLIQAWIK